MEGADEQAWTDPAWRLAASRHRIGLWRYDPRAQALTWSETLEQLLGFAPSDPRAAAKRVEARLEPASRGALVEQVACAIETGAPVDIEIGILDGRQQLRWLRLLGDAVTSGDGQIVVRGSAQDVSEHRRARVAAEALAERLRIATEGGGLGLFELELATGRVQLDAAARRLHGAGQSAALASFDDEPIVEADRVELARLFADLGLQERVQAHYRIRAGDGTLRWLELTGRVIRDEGSLPEQVIGVLRDVTEARESEARVRESEARLRLIERSLDAVFWIADPELTELRYVSPAVERLFGVSPQLLQGPRGLQLLRDRMSDEERQRAQVVLREAERTGRRTWRLDHRLERSSGEVVWLSHSGAVTGDAQEGAQVVGVTTDITQQRRVEEDLLRASKLEAVGRLAGGIAHDFNNLLSVITGYANVGLLDAATEPERESFQRIADAARQAAGLTRRLLLLGRPQPPDIRPVQLGELVRNLEAFLRRVFGPGVRWEVEVEDPLPDVAADPAQLEQVLLNLAVNARDAIGGDGRLQIGARAQRCPVGGPGVQVWVEDDGEGIPPELHGRVFEPFFTTKPEGEGTGLGLPTVRTVLERLGGRVELDSEVGRGTRFELWLPAAAPAPRPPPQSRSSAPRTEPAPVAVVDDDDMVRKTVQRSLRRAGFEPVEFSDALSFLRALDASEARVDAVVSDVRMPGMSGLELVAELRRRYPGLPVLLVSGYVEAGDAGLPDGVSLLAKPFTHADLIARVQRLVE